jgi:hypothetical protein
MYGKEIFRNLISKKIDSLELKEERKIIKYN